MEGFTAMHFAVFNHNLAMMEYLYSKGADLKKISEEQTSGVSLMHVAAQSDAIGSMAFIKEYHWTTF